MPPFHQVQERVAISPPPLSPVEAPPAGGSGHSVGPAESTEPAERTPGSRRVSWADLASRPLCAVRTFERTEGPDWFTATVVAPLARPLPLPSAVVSPVSPPLVVFNAQALPSTEADLLARLEKHGIQLESVLIRPPTAFLTVRVLNTAFDKHVFVRYTIDQWCSYRDVPAVFGSSVTQKYDRFFVSLAVPSYLPGATTEFCFCCRSNGHPEVWDNNGSKNYKIAVPLT